MGPYYLKFKLDNNTTINVTPSHPFAHPEMDERGLKKANEFKVGDLLLIKNLDYIAINSIHKVYQPIKNYNLEISNNHTFIVYGVIVGNMTWIKEAGAAAPPPSPVKP